MVGRIGHRKKWYALMPKLVYNYLKALLICYSIVLMSNLKVFFDEEFMVSIHLTYINEVEILQLFIILWE